MYRTFVILRHTFLEAVLQPIYSLLLAVGAGVLVIFSLLPFFTLGEDTTMFKAVGLDVILILVLIATLFAASKSIYEEIEDRTMLTLMSKPVAKWEVLIGKYLGLVTSALLAVALLGAVLVLATWWRIPGDYQLRATSLDDREVRQVMDLRLMHISGLLPSLLLLWMQIAVLTAVSVAISTRVPLVVNLPVVILLYIAGNLTRFVFPIAFGNDDRGTPLAGRSAITKAFAYVLSLVLPYLATFDLRQKTVYSRIKVRGYSDDINAVALAEIWRY